MCAKAPPDCRIELCQDDDVDYLIGGYWGEELAEAESLPLGLPPSEAA